jgi:hypothetical protein
LQVLTCEPGWVVHKESPGLPLKQADKPGRSLPFPFPKARFMAERLRNIAIIAHVDHGKTTLVDQLLKPVGAFRANRGRRTRAMDRNDQERERGITILAKCTSVLWKERRGLSHQHRRHARPRRFRRRGRTHPGMVDGASSWSTPPKA